MSFKAEGLWPSAPNTTRGQATKIGSYGSKLSYTNGRTVIIRDLEDPGKTISYVGHVQPTTVARISPSGYYCASADIAGNVRIWDIVGEDKVLKGEYRVISGRINDLSWDGESKRIIAVGDGKEKYGHAFMMDSGSSVGEIIGHNKTANSVAMRSQRPFRAATAADDRTIVFHNGVPYKYDKTITTHSNFVLSLAYAPSGDLFASSGADYKVFLYDGKTGETKYELQGAHKGSVNSVVFSLDSKSLLSSSADCTVKLWDIETQKSVNTWTVGTGVQHQQMGNTWLGSTTSSPDASIVSLSMSGDINIFDKRVSDKPVKIIHGLQKAATSAALSPSSNSLIAGSADGRIVAYSTNDGVASPLSGYTHSALIAGLASSSNSVWSAGYDDWVREIVEEGPGKFKGDNGSAVSSQPKSIAAAGDKAYVALSGKVEVFQSGKKVDSVPLQYEATVIAVSASLVIAVGAQDNKVRLYEGDLKSAKPRELENNRAAITYMAFSPDSKMLAVGDSSGKIVLYDVKEAKMITGRWSFHTARINSLSWTSDSQHLASGSLDTDIYIWSVAKPLKTIPIKNAVPGGVNTISWVRSEGSKGVIAGAGADPTFRTWEVTFHPV